MKEWMKLLTVSCIEGVHWCLYIIKFPIQRGSDSHDCVFERETCFNSPQIITVLFSRSQLKPHFL